MLTLEDRFVGCLLGAAIGDALGMPFALEQPDHAESPVRDFQNSRGVCPVTVPVAELGVPEAEPLLRAGQWTDDTQLMIALANCIISEAGLFIPDAWAHALVQWLNASPRGPGLSSLQAAMDLRGGGISWDEGTDPEGAGCGAACRAPVIALWACADPAARMDAAILQAQATHGHGDAMASAVAIAEAVAVAVQSDPNEGSHGPALFAASSAAVRAKFGNAHPVAECIDLGAHLLESGTEPGQALRILGTSAWCRESVPAAIYCAARWAHSPEDAIIAAVNHGGAADGIGAMTGALVGAASGPESLPQRWRSTVEDGSGLVHTAVMLYACRRQ